jgi:hypothetical protein
MNNLIKYVLCAAIGASIGAGCSSREPERLPKIEIIGIEPIYDWPEIKIIGIEPIYDELRENDNKPEGYKR